MWKLNEVYAENICAFGELHYVLHQGVTTLVFGNNMDNESQRSNGSGKSALIESIAVGITGSPLRKVKNEEIINDAADECRIQLQFFNDVSTEVFSISRSLYRKGGSTVECRIERDGKAVMTDEAVRPGVDSYNKYILEKLGITKDELFNNFILSKHKYQDFLSSSDKEKKEIINRFSHANLVDGAIEQIIQDKTPLERDLHQAELEVAGLDGRVEMLVEQIEKEENSAEEKAQTKAGRLADMDNSIGEKRALIRDYKEEIEVLKVSFSCIEQTDKKMQILENGELSIGEFIEEITRLLLPLKCGSLSDWKGVMVERKEKIDRLDRELSAWDTALDEAGKKLHEITIMRNSLNEEYRLFSENYQVEIDGYDEELERLDAQMNNLSVHITRLGTQKSDLTTALQSLKNKLAGTITCPACRHQFILADESFDVKAAREQVKEKENRKEEMEYLLADCRTQTESIEQSEKNIRISKRALTNQHTSWEEKLQGTEKTVRVLTDEKEEAIRQRERTVRQIIDMQNELDGIRRKIFDEAFSLLDDAYKGIERKIGNQKEEIETAGSAILMLEKTIKELKESSDGDILNSLKVSLKEFRAQSCVAIAAKEKLEKELKELNGQVEIFSQFKSFLANSKIAALAKVTNEFLENIGSDIRLHFSGFTTLKSGKVREKISVSLLRSGIDCGSFDKFSEGEKCRVNLATILAMQELVNGNCEGDKGLDLLVLDEILAAVDEDGLASMFHALNGLGITSLVVSHGNISESYPYKLIIHKQDGKSYINNLNQ